MQNTHRVFEREHDLKLLNDNLRATLLSAHADFKNILELNLDIDLEKRIIKAEAKVDSVTTALKKINQMITLNHYSGNKWKKMELSIPLKYSIEKQKLRAEKKNQKIIFNNSTKIAISYGDLLILEEFMFDNLISNAIKFSPDNSEIQIQLDCDKNYNIITISDNGVGISTQELEKINSITEHYFTPDTDGNSGSGMSFPMTAQILKKLNGHMEVSSSTETKGDKSRGTTIKLFFNRF